MHIHADTSARLRVFDGVGKDVNIDLVQPQLVGIKIFFFKPADTEIEIDILFLDHRLGQVDEVFHRFNDGEGQRAEVQFSAFNLGNVQNIIDQRKQVFAGQRDFPQVFANRFRIAGILFSNCREPDDRVHRRADIMGHGGEEIGFCLVRRSRFFRRSLEFLVKAQDDRQVKYEQDQETRRNKTDQQPVFGAHVQVFHRHEAEKRPSSCRGNRCIGEYTFLTLGIEDGDRTGRRSYLFKEILRRGGICSVVRPVKLKETGVFEGMAFDDIVSG